MLITMLKIVKTSLSIAFIIFIVAFFRILFRGELNSITIYTFINFLTYILPFSIAIAIYLNFKNSS